MKKNVLLTLFIAVTFVLAEDVVHDVPDNDDVDITDPIDVNNYVSTTVNQNQDQWENGDTLTLNKGNQTALYQYSAMFGRFVPVSVSSGGDSSGGGYGGGSSTGGLGSGGNQGGANDDGSFDGCEVWVLDVRCA